MSKKFYTGLIVILATMNVGLVQGQNPGPISHYEYVFPPGSIDVYDMDNGFTLVKSVPLSQTQGLATDAVRGAVASPVTGMLYISYGSYFTSGGNMLKYDLVKDQVVWAQTYPFGIDSHSISPDGRTIYMPDGESSTNGTWEIIDANTGNVVGQLNSGGLGPHNTITSLNGAHFYMGPRYTHYLVLGATATLSVIGQVGPTSAGIRPFTINSEETYAFITTSNKVGFYVGSINTGQILYWVCPPGYCWTSGSFNGASGVSHGISLSPDEKEVYLIDYPYNHVHVFDVTSLPGSAPADVADIALKCTMKAEGWLQHSRDGRFVFVGNCGDVISTATRQVVANLPALLNTRIFNEVDFQNGVPSFSPLSRNQGGYLTQTSGVSLSSTSLNFGNQTVGTTSSPRTVTLTNNTNSVLSITSIAITGTNSGDYSQAHTCGSSLGAGASCTISVTFTPATTGTRIGAVTITDSDPTSPQTVSLTGMGVTTDFGLSTTPATQTVTAGAGTSYKATVSPLNGFSGTVSFSVSGLPSGATGSFSPSSVSGGSGSSTLSVSTASTTAAGSYTLTITGTSGSITHNASAQLVVQPVGTPDFGLSGTPGTQTVTAGAGTSYKATVSPLNGFSGTVSFSVSGLPSGATGSFSPSSVSGGSGSSTLSVSTASTTAAGAYTLTITGTSGSITHNASAQLVVQSGGGTPDFGLSETPGTQTVTAGAGTSYKATVSPLNGFSGTVSFSVSGLPSGATGSFSPSSVSGGSGSSTLSVSTASTTAAGAYTLTITGTSGSITHNNSAQLAVQSGDFSGSVSPTAATINVGGSTTFQVNLNSTGSFSGQFTFSCANPPKGIACSFSPANATLPANGTASSTLTVAVNSMPAGAIPSAKPLQRPPGWVLIGAPTLLWLGLALFLLRRARFGWRVLVRVAVPSLAVWLILLGQVSCGGGTTAAPPSPTTVTLAVQASSPSRSKTVGTLQITVP